MKKNLTLTIKSSVIEQAKLYAQGTGRSLSEIVERHLESISKESFNKEKLLE